MSKYLRFLQQRVNAKIDDDQKPPSSEKKAIHRNTDIVVRESRETLQFHQPAKV